MATLALGALGAAAGSALLPAGLSVFGTTIAGAAVGSQIGALADHVVDQAPLRRVRTSTRGRWPAVVGCAHHLIDGRCTNSAPLRPAHRLGGQMIWACNLNETHSCAWVEWKRIVQRWARGQFHRR